MIEARVVVLDENGLHARPAAQFVKTANSFACDIWIGKDGRMVNAKSIVSVLSLGVGMGNEIVVRAQGRDEEKALEELKKLINKA